jgi:hypothetical protein
MSRQNKQVYKSNIKKQVTALHKKSIDTHGTKRTKQPKEGRIAFPFSKKLTSKNKGVRPSGEQV